VRLPWEISTMPMAASIWIAPRIHLLRYECQGEHAGGRCGRRHPGSADRADVRGAAPDPVLHSGAVEPRPVTDLVAHAEADLGAGTVLTASGQHHSIAGVSGRMVPASSAPAPWAGATRSVPSGGQSTAGSAGRKGTLIRCADVELDSASALMGSRADQDRMFFPRDVSI